MTSSHRTWSIPARHLVRHRGASQHTSTPMPTAFSRCSVRRRETQSGSVGSDAGAVGRNAGQRFLEYLETTRGNSAETRNIRWLHTLVFPFSAAPRTAAIEQVRVFWRSLQEDDTRWYRIWSRKKCRLCSTLPTVHAAGVRDRAMLHLAVCAGLRVSELTGLRVEDVAPQSASIRIRGKGRRERRCLSGRRRRQRFVPGWPSAVRSHAELFVNARGEPFSRWGVAYVLRCHTKAAIESVQRCTASRSRPTCSATLRDGGTASDSGHRKVSLCWGTVI